MLKWVSEREKRSEGRRKQENNKRKKSLKCFKNDDIMKI